MENFDDFATKNYKPAEKKVYDLKDHARFHFKFIKVVYLVTIGLFFEFIGCLVGIFSPKKPKKISGQIALVTGGANGLGRAIAFRLAQEGCDVVIVDLNLPEAMKTADEISTKFKVETAAYQVDVSNYDEIVKLKEKIESTLGSVDILVNNAGILSLINLLEGQAKDVQKVIDVNLTSHFWTLRVFLPKMVEKKCGHIIAIASMSAKMSIPMACLYTATKFGVRGLMNALYDDLSVDGRENFIKTTTVYPSFISTRKELGDILDQLDEFTPRMTPEYVADEIVRAMLKDKVELNLPPGSGITSAIVDMLPPKLAKTAKLAATAVSNLKSERNAKSE